MKFWRIWSRREAREADLERELRSHLDLEAEEQRDAGLSPEEAQYAAQRALGNTVWVKEDVRMAWGFQWLETLLQDLRYGLRQLRRNPGFTVVAVLTLALGIGANTAIFSLVDAVLLKMLPVQKPEQLYRLTSINIEGKANDAFSYPTFKLLEANNQTLSGVIAFRPLGNVDFVVNGNAELARGQAVSGSYFKTLGVKPILGRTITAEDDVRGANPVAVISYGYWKARFNRSPSVAGAGITLNGAAFTVIGVTPPEFFGLEPGESVDVSIPLGSFPVVQPQFAAAGTPFDVLTAPFRHWLHLMARLKDGETEPRALANLGPVYEQAMRQAAEGMPGLPFDSPRARKEFHETRIQLESASRGLTALREQFSKPLMFLMAVVGVLLLIACTNVANLLLARAARRQREIALRLSLGAGRVRVIRQLLTESVLLAGAGAAFGVLVAFWESNAVVSLMSHSALAVQLNVHPDARVLVFTGLVSLMAVVIFGLAPAWRASRLDLSQAVKETAQGAAAAPGRSRMAESLVIPQIALSLVLMVGAGLLVRTLQKLKNTNPGFDRQNVLLFSINPGMIGYKEAHVAELCRRLTEQMRAIPGVSAVSFSTFSPLAGWSGFTDARVEGYTPKPGENPAITVNFAGPEYFKTLGTVVLQGRDFTEADKAGTPKVAVINQAMAQHFFGDTNPIGRRFSIPGWKADASALEIVGVVENTKLNSLREPPPPTAYMPFLQSPDSFLAETFEVRSATNPTVLTASVRQLIQQADNRLPIFGVRTLSEQLDESLVQERLVASLSSLFGLVALFLACVGLYGVMASLVARRTHEIGIRIALGARRVQVIGLVLKRGMTLALIGIGAGTLAALGLTRLMAGLLFGVKPTDSPTFVVTMIILAAVAALACYIPARRAASTDPMVALRRE
jgi:putative ABC transport system permease protein